MTPAEALGELSAEIEKIPALEKRLAVLEERPSPSQSEWPELIGLRELCERCGLSYNTMRKAEYRHQLPNRGVRDVSIAGREYWRRSPTVENWLRELSSKKGKRK